MSRAEAEPDLYLCLLTQAEVGPTIAELLVRGDASHDGAPSARLTHIVQYSNNVRPQLQTLLSYAAYKLYPGQLQF